MEVIFARKEVHYDIDSEYVKYKPILLGTGYFNNDNQIDLMVTSWNSNTIGILLSYSNGSFSRQPIFPTGAVPYGVILSVIIEKMLLLLIVMISLSIKNLINMTESDIIL